MDSEPNRKPLIACI